MHSCYQVVFCLLSLILTQWREIILIWTNINILKSDTDVAPSYLLQVCKLPATFLSASKRLFWIRFSDPHTVCFPIIQLLLMHSYHLLKKYWWDKMKWNFSKIIMTAKTPWILENATFFNPNTIAFVYYMLYFHNPVLLAFFIFSSAG